MGNLFCFYLHNTFPKNDIYAQCIFMLKSLHIVKIYMYICNIDNYLNFNIPNYDEKTIFGSCSLRRVGC